MIVVTKLSRVVGRVFSLIIGEDVVSPALDLMKERSYWYL